MPKGCPKAIAPPLIFSCSSISMPKASADPNTCTANASFISTRSMSLISIPARSNTCRHASIGPRPIISGFKAETPLATIRAKGCRPSSLARVSLITTTAAAPSLRGQALPAVIVPPGRNTGFSCETPSRVVPSLIPSSFDTTDPSGSVYGVISCSKKPRFIAASARF